MIPLSVLLAATLLGNPGEGSPDPSVRAIWITRFDYASADDVRRAIAESAGAGFNTVLFQVRGNASTFYPSRLEPWAAELGGADPGFDPLAVALEEAHARAVELHAWVNVVPAWWGTEPPRDPAHVYSTHPEWFWYDQHGRRQPLCERFYVSLNPCLPEVRTYLTSVLEELVTNYALDGLHLDYLRFPNEPPGTPEDSDADYPRDARTLALYREATGRAPDDDGASWDRWRTDQVTRLLRDIRGMVWRVRPGLPVTAAVGSELERALEHHQDVRAWLEQGLLDAVFPMNYTSDPGLFQERLAGWSALARDQQVVMGLMIASGPSAERQGQVRAAESAFGHYSVFAYSALFDSPNTAIDRQDEAARRERAERRSAFLPFFRRLAGR